MRNILMSRPIWVTARISAMYESTVCLERPIALPISAERRVVFLLYARPPCPHRYVRDPLVVQEMKRLQEMADVNAVACVTGIPEKIGEAAHKAIEVLKEILDDERKDPEIQKLRSNVAREVLSLAGYGPVKQVRIDQASVSTHFTGEEIEDIKRRAIEEGFAKLSPLNAHLVPDMVVDAEVKEIGETGGEDAEDLEKV